MTDPRSEEIDRAAAAHDETEEQVLDRNVMEILQELRVLETGVQILFAFLLSIAFSSGFEHPTDRQRVVYTATLMLSAASTALFIAPVSLHRVVFRRRQRQKLVETSHRMAFAGIVFLLLAMVGAVVLTLDKVIGGTAMWVLAAVAAVWFLWLWIALPLSYRRHPPEPSRR